MNIAVDAVAMAPLAGTGEDSTPAAWRKLDKTLDEFIDIGDRSLRFDLS